MKTPPPAPFSPSHTLGEVLDILRREIEAAKAAPARSDTLATLRSQHAAVRLLLFGAGQGERL